MVDSCRRRRARLPKASFSSLCSSPTRRTLCISIFSLFSLPNSRVSCFNISMAEAAVSFLLENLVESAKSEVNRLRGGEDVVRWIEYESETLIPQLERASALSDQHDNLTNMIRKAEVLAETYTKRVIQSKAAKLKNPINLIRIIFITRQLHKIKREIARETDPPWLHSAAAEPRDEQSSVPFYLRQCMHYLLLFPPELEVPARRLIVLWVSEGLVHSKKYDSQSVEDIAEAYLNELVHLQVLSVKRNRSGKVKTCRIDGRRQNALLDEAKRAHFLQDRNGKIRRLVDHNHNDSDPSPSFIQIDGDPKVLDYRNVISFLSFNTKEGSKPGEDLGDFLRKCISAGCFIWLRSLDLEGVFRPKLPNTLGKLIALKYLGLRWTYLEKLPDTVDSLLNLQVLDVKHTYITTLPRSIWSMEYLRHLYLSEAYRTRFPAPPSRGVTLTALHTLWGAFIDEDTRIIRGLDTLLNIRKLGLSCRSTPSNTAEMTEQLKAIDKWISNLQFLHSLRLKSRDETGKAARLHLTSLEGNKNLSTVYLLGKLDRLILCELPVSLTDITLSGSALDLDPMGFLGRLPNLLILRLLAQSVVCKKMYCSRRGFRRLKLLWLWNLQNLEELEAEDGSLPSLEELEIRSCNKLNELPHRLPRRQNLEIKLTSMLPEFVRRAEGKYDKVLSVPKDDQYILTNTRTRYELEIEDHQRPISGNNTPGPRSIF